MKTEKKKKEKRSQKKCCISAQAIEKGIINLDWVWHLLWFIIIWGPTYPPQTCVCNIAQCTRKVHLGQKILDLETVFGSFRQFGQNYGPYGMPANTKIQDKFQREFQEKLDFGPFSLTGVTPLSYISIVLFGDAPFGHVYCTQTNSRIAPTTNVNYPIVLLKSGGKQ